MIERAAFDRMIERAAFDRALDESVIALTPR
jgi:hypothetical protein